MAFARILVVVWLLQRLATYDSLLSSTNLDSLIQNQQLKFVFVGGKGGVGKTTTSSAIAAQLSASGRRVLLISTDPAHSLGDAFRMKFSNVPTAILPVLPNLHVMEVNPVETMKSDLEGWNELATELGYDPDANAPGGDGGIGDKIHSFQEWLSGVPGIDEATALSSAIEHIESGRYDIIVFDTAPTGHTLKLLELPKILQIGLDKLESWQATLWGYWEMIRGFSIGKEGDTSGARAKVAEKLKAYKASISRVANMIVDRERTRFVVVCIAEYLSVSETRRLLSELDRFGVLASHVVVNQLVKGYLEDFELAELEELARSKAGEEPRLVLEKALAASKLATARRSIQNKYLNDLRSSPEVNRQPDLESPQTRTNQNAGTEPLTVLEVPLLTREVTGAEAILSFSKLLVGEDVARRPLSTAGMQSETSKPTNATVQEHVVKEFAPQKSAPSQSGSEAQKKVNAPSVGELNKARGVIDELMKDPELKDMLTNHPRLLDIVTEVKNNPMAGMKFIADPDPVVKAFFGKAMGKLTGGKKVSRQNLPPRASSKAFARQTPEL